MADQVVAFLAALAETERLPPERLRLYQERLLERLLRHARAETDFYPERLKPLFRADDSIDWDRWRELPILTRAEAREKSAGLVARSMVPAAGDAIERTTSGSTGQPLRHYTTQIQNMASACANERFFRWHGLDPSALTAFIRATDNPRAAYPEGSASDGWRPTHPESRSRTLSLTETPIDRQIEWLLRIRPDHLVSYPSNLAEIARQASAAGLQMPASVTMTMGETTTDDAASAIRAHFGREPIDRYGATEVGLVAASCPHSGAYHAMAELVLLEIVGEDGHPAPPGTAGRAIVTPFYNHAMPLIRYDVGDYAVAAATPCRCGRTLPTVERILGRINSVFRFIDGSSVWPAIRSREFQGLVPHRQYQLVQATMTRVELRYVPVSADQVNDPAGLTAYIRGRLHPTLDVDLVAVAKIERSATGKYEETLSLVSQARASPSAVPD